ncbi:MAG: hypothetical protein M5R36_14215 [Deltaproteobacteria bacterium]|nr:hypothetical protein [Deltaproteobacteria bacterium]
MAHALVVMVYAGHWLAEIGNHVLRQHPWWTPAVIAVPVAMVAVRERLAERRSWVIHAAAAVYYAALAAYMAFSPSPRPWRTRGFPG